MPIQVQCSSCKAAWNVADEKATVAGKCPRCGAAVTVQEAAPPSPPPAQKGISLSSGMAAAGALLQHLAPDAGAPTVLEIEHARTDPRRRFGHFIVLSLVGKGGMGAVYRAWDDNLRRTVALKVVLSSQDGTSATSLQRFQREAHAIARLRHPCIVSVHDTGEIGGKPYLAMDFIVGTTLERRIGKRTGTILDTPERAARLPLTKAVEVLRDVSRAVQYAHEQGVIHRDLKPGNIMLDAKDHPFVLDFGLAKVRDDASFVTKGGGAMGTPAYMPPEQAGGTSEEVDERSDIYALGATLYHAIAGRPPFEGESEINVITLLLTKDARPPSTYNRLATGDLDTICLKCLEKDKKKRFQSAGDIAAELDRYLAGEPILTRPLGFLGRAGRSLRRNARTVAIAGLAALLSTGAVLYPALQSSLEESGRRAASARAREAVLEAARSLRGKTGTALEKSTKRLDGLRSGPRGFLSDVAQVVSELDTGTLALADESALRAELRAAGTAAGGPKTPAPDLERALEDGLTLLGRGALLAKAARERGRGFQLLSRPTDAAKERARAYRLDPAGEDGARAFVEIAEDLLEREDWPRALGLFRTIASRKLPPAISARANVGEARALIALEKPEAARSLLSRALSQKVLGERETAEARWFLAVASRLSGTVSGPVDGGSFVVKRLSPGPGPPEVFAMTGEGKLAALRLEKTGSRLVLLDSIAVGPGPRSLVLLKTEGGERLAVATEERGCTIELYRFEADHLALDRKVPIAPELAGASILAAGALSRQGEDDLVLAVRGPQGLAVPVHVSDLSGTPRVQVVVDPMCYEISATIADLDGDGQNELILGIGQWKGYCVKVYKLEAGGPLREVFSRALGTPRGFSVSGGPRQYVLCAADRMREGDAIFQDEPGLAPDRPDAVWKLSWTTEPVLEKVLERPFEERDRWSFWLPSPFVAPWKTYPGAFLAGENGDGWQRFVFVPPPGLPPVRARASSGVGMLADLDGDGEPDLLFGGSPIRVSGLRAVTDTEKEVPAAEATEASALDVGLDLLACGQAKEAALALEAVIQRPETPPAESSRARVALAQAQALLGLHDRARKTCLALADADPRSAKEALFLASAHAEEGREIASAVADLERLRRFETLSQDEDREVERRLRRLRPLALMKECVRFDRRTAAQLPLEVKKPLFVHLSDKGVRIMGRPDAGVPGDERSASIRLPLRYDGSSFRLSMRFLVEHLGYDQGMTIGFSAPRDGEGGMDGLSAYVECRGGGNIDTFERTLAANGGWGFDVGEFEPSMPANVELTYVNADAFVHGALEYGGVSRKVDFPVGPLVSGKASLGIGLRGIHGNFASFELIEVVLSGPPGAIAIDSSGETDPAARALRAFSLEDPKRALETCEGWGEKAKDEPSRRTAAFLAALALADSGKVDEAAERINALRQKAPEETDALWARDVYGLTERERAALVRAVAAWPQDPPAAIADRARSLLSQGRAGEAAIAFLAAGDAGRGMHAFEQAHAWEACGRYEQALALLEPLARDERAATMAGFMAFELSRHKLAVEFWDRIVDMPGQLKVYRDRSRRFSRDPSK